MFSQDSLLLFQELLKQVQINPTHPDAEQVFARVRAAHLELEAALQAQAG